ncbi:MAG: efflux RND transporter periplasmic adaptor subunit [Bacteroidales bacterium]|nr:efflux RND transporter periplasmic adaptor subunit [Bacteroidales bacterium]
MIKKIYIFWAVAISMSACQQKEKHADGVPEVVAQPAQTETVTLAKLEKRDFKQQLVSNGKVRALEYADLNFRVSNEPIAKIYVSEGDQVQAGQKLAELDMFSLKNKLTQAQNRLEQSQLDMKDVLIGQGYDPENTGKIPAEVMRLARVKSGYELNLSQYQQAEFDMQHAVLTAPISGVVANITTRAHSLPGAEPLCRIISTNPMEVEFTVMESELPLVERRSRVNVTPYAQPDAVCEGTVTGINPIVDENGQIRVKASIQGHNTLMDGMNVRVTVDRMVPDQLVVPKSAVVLRTGKQVIFDYRDGQAKWNYVTVTLENLTEYAVEGESLEEGMQVIVSGNLNLAHDAPVKVEKEQ